MNASSRLGLAWRPIAVFYVIACAWSWPLFWWRDLRPPSWQAWGLPVVLKTALYMWGPGLAALVCWRFCPPPQPRRFSFFGPRPRITAAFFAVPGFILLACQTLPGPGASAPGLAALLLGASFMTVLGEEVGWRGFLQVAVGPLPAWRRYLIIAVLWELWHFTTHRINRPLLGAVIATLIFIAVLFLLSVIIGQAVERSSSILVAQTLHTWFDLVFELPGWRTVMALGLSMPLWLWLLRRPTETSQ
jgi:uncharacterized protein